MKNDEVKKYWEKNAENWTRLARMGYDRCRDLINSPGFFSILPSIKGMKGLDIGCGEGYNTRIAADKGGMMTAIDISESFIKYAVEEEHRSPLKITYKIASATEIPFDNNSFDFAMATMSLMDMADVSIALKEIYRILKPGGFFQFSITHPCFCPPLYDWIRDEKGRKTARVVGEYFSNQDGELDEWIFGTAPKNLTQKMDKFQIPRFHKTLSEWLNLLIQAGFNLEKFHEPMPDPGILEQYPEEYDAFIVPLFLIVRVRKANC